MDFCLNEEQQMLRDSARRLLAENIPAGASDRWGQFAQQGWLAMAIPVGAGGLGSSVEDVAILVHEMGRALVTEPLIPGAIVSARILHHCNLFPQQETLLNAMASGYLRFAIAIEEREHRYDWLHASTSVTRNNDGGYVLSGRKILVAGGDQADRFIVSAKINDSTDSVALFLVDGNLAGVERSHYETIDGVKVSDIWFNQVNLQAADLIADPALANVTLAEVFDEAAAYLCAETVGCMEKVMELTIDYLKVRNQFGRPLAEFQVLQHAVAEIYIELESARSILYSALASLNAPVGLRRKAVSACKIKTMSAAKRVMGAAVHLHGGMGITSEYPVGHFLRRSVVSAHRLGDEQFHLERYMSTGH